MMRDLHTVIDSVMKARRAQGDDRRGFTMTEMLVVVAITVVMFSIGFVGVIQYSRMFTFLKMNETATEIYLVAQDQMARGVELNGLQAKLNVARGKNADGTDDSDGEVDEEYLGTQIPSTDTSLGTSNNGQYYYVFHNGSSDADKLESTVLKDMLPALSIDDAIRTNGRYVVVYNAETATVVCVWYTEIEDNEVNASKLTAWSNAMSGWETMKTYMSTEDAGDTVRRQYYEDYDVPIGYYGGDTVNVRRISLTDISVSVNNGNRLTAIVNYPNTIELTSNQKATLQLVVTGQQSGAIKTIEVGTKTGTGALTASTTTDSAFGLDEVSTITANNLTIEGIGITLDDVTSASAHFAQLFKVGDDNTTAFVPGEDLDLYATLTFEGMPGTSHKSNHVVVNSLFGGVAQSDGQPITASGQTAGNIKVSNFRHLENLNNDVSNYTLPTGTLTVAQTTDLVWGTTDSMGTTLADVSDDTINPFVNSSNYSNRYDTTQSDYDQTSGVIYSYKNGSNSTGSPIIGSNQRAFYGISVSDVQSFTYNGNGNYIYNVTVQSASSGGPAGLFREVTYTSADSHFEIENVKMVAPTVTATTYAGALVGRALTKSSNGNANLNLSSAFILSNCSVAPAKADTDTGYPVQITGKDAVGGLVGSVIGFNLASSDGTEGTQVVNCSVNGDLGTATNGNRYEVIILSEMEGSRASTGGLIGECGLSTGTIEQCYVQGERLTVSSPNVGDSDGFTNRRGAGGFIGTLYSSNGISVNDCYAAVQSVLSGRTAGGFIGTTDNLDVNPAIVITNCYASGRTTGGEYSESDYNVTATGNKTSAGGFIGLVATRDHQLQLSYCYSTASVKSTATDSAAGGFVGSVGDMRNENYGNLSVKNCYSTGLIYAVGNTTSDANRHAFIGVKKNSDSIIDASDNYYLQGINTKVSESSSGYATGATTALAGSGDATAAPYDDEVLPNIYTFKTCAELSDSEDLKMTTEHVGDWPYTDITDEPLYIVNANRLSVVIFSATPRNAVIRIADPTNANAYVDKVVNGTSGTYGSTDTGDWTLVASEADGSKQKYYYEWVLDDPATEARSFYKQFGSTLTPGLDYVATASWDTTAYLSGNVKGTATFNSLFADNNTVDSVYGLTDSLVTGGSTAYIAYARHLQNLNPYISNVTSSITSAVQIRDLTWAKTLGESAVGETTTTTGATVVVNPTSAYANFTGLNTVWTDAQTISSENIYQYDSSNSNKYTSDGCFAPIENANLSSYDGQSHVINNFQAKGSRAGLFGIVSSDLAISNLTVNGASSDASASNDNYTANSNKYKAAGQSSAVLVAENYGNLVFDNISAAGTITIYGAGTSDAGSGILVGKNCEGGTITVNGDFSMTGDDSSLTIDGQANSGGLIGCSLSSNTITFSNISLAPKSISIATSASNARGAGGVVGYVNAGILSFEGNVAITSPTISITCPSNVDRHAAGGVVGFAQNGGVMHTAEGTTTTVDPGTAGSFSVTARLFAGGILGYYFDNGALTDNQFVFNAPMYIKGKAVTVTTTGTSGNSSVGGLIGFIDKPASITDSYVEASESITLETKTANGIKWGGAGGLIGGSSYKLAINNCRFADEDHPGTLKVVGTETYAGGIIAHVCGNESSITGSSAYFTITGVTSCGGIVGQVDNIKNTQNSTLVAENTSFMLDSCTAVGTVASTGRAGGLIGNISTPGLVIRNNCLYGGSSVKSTNSNAGGLIGAIEAASDPAPSISSATITNSNGVAVTGYNSTGGAVGWSANRISISNTSFSNGTIEVSSKNHVGGLLGECSMGASISGNSQVSNAIIKTAQYAAGGLVGFAKGSRTDVSSSTVSGVTITGVTHAGGVVGYTEAGVKLSDGVTVSGSTITGSSNTAGGLVGYCKGSEASVSGSTVSASTVSGAPYVGGLMGQTDGCVASISSSAVNDNTTVTGTTDAGGVVGHANNGVSITNGAVSGATITSSNSCAGGLVGYTQGGSASITASSVSGSAVTGYGSTGGAVGQTNTSISIADSSFVSNSKVVSKNSNVGGLVGFINNSSESAISDSCVQEGDTNDLILGKEHAGGIVGYTKGSLTVTGCYNNGMDVISGGVQNNSGWCAGGLAGYVEGSSSWTESYVTDAYGTQLIYGGSHSGGFVGQAGSGAKNLDMSDCFSTAFVASQYKNAGGFFGIANTNGSSASDPDIIENCYVGGHVVDSGNNTFLYGTDAPAVTEIDLEGGTVTYTLSKSCYNVSSLTSKDSNNRNAGGLIGTLYLRNGYLKMENVYSTASAYGGKNSGGIGGFIGWIDPFTYTEHGLICNDCYATGLVGVAAGQGTGAVSSFIGNNWSYEPRQIYLGGTGAFFLTGINTSTADTIGKYVGATPITYAELMAKCGTTAYGALPFLSSLGGTYPFPAVTATGFEGTAFCHRGDWPVLAQNTVTFNANGHGTAPAEQRIYPGGKATVPTAPTAEGYTFGGWYTDAACTEAYDFNAVVTSSMTLYAKWTDDLTGQSDTSSQVVTTTTTSVTTATTGSSGSEGSAGSTLVAQGTGLSTSENVSDSTASSADGSSSEVGSSEDSSEEVDSNTDSESSSSTQEDADSSTLEGQESGQQSSETLDPAA